MQQFINFLLRVHTDNDNITIIITIIIAAHTQSYTRNSKYTVTIYSVFTERYSRKNKINKK